MAQNDFVKITEDVFYDTYEKDGPDGIRRLLAGKVDTLLFGNVADYEENLLTTLIDCESPIEQLLALEMKVLNIEQMSLYNPFIEDVIITNQENIEAQGEKYRADFSVAVIYKKDKNSRKDIYYHFFVIECDGYEFHQKTKEQVEKDNIRTRNLQKKGYDVIHFSGSEIWKNPRKCAKEVITLILSKCEY